MCLIHSLILLFLLHKLAVGPTVLCHDPHFTRPFSLNSHVLGPNLGALFRIFQRGSIGVLILVVLVILIIAVVVVRFVIIALIRHKTVGTVTVTAVGDYLCRALANGRRPVLDTLVERAAGKGRISQRARLWGSRILPPSVPPALARASRRETGPRRPKPARGAVTFFFLCRRNPAIAGRWGPLVGRPCGCSPYPVFPLLRGGGGLRRRFSAPPQQ